MLVHYFEEIFGQNQKRNDHTLNMKIFNPSALITLLLPIVSCQTPKNDHVVLQNSIPILQEFDRSENNSAFEDCDYFGLEQPGTIPQVFNPQLLHLNGSFKFNVELKACDAIYFTAMDSEENIYFSEKRNGQWREPKIASFSDPDYGDADPFLSADGKRIYYISKRPTHPLDKQFDWNIWYTDHENNGWAIPKPLPKPINSDEFDEYFFSISNQGNVFFSSDRNGGQGSFDIYTAAILNDHAFSEPKNIGAPINTEKFEFDPYISPNEEFMIFSINEDGNSSLYFSKKDQKNNWTTPQNLGNTINLTNQDFAPSLSADGKFIFYSNDGKLKWVSAEILNTVD